LLIYLFGDFGIFCRRCSMTGQDNIACIFPAVAGVFTTNIVSGNFWPYEQL